MPERLGEEEITSRLRESEWRRDGDAITRTWRVADFAAAVAFVGRIAEAAERANHHPDISIHAYNRVTLTLSTHSAGGLTGADFALAATVDGLAP